MARQKKEFMSIHEIKHVIFDLSTETKSSTIPTLKSSRVLLPTHKTQVNLHARTDIKVIFGPWDKTNPISNTQREIQVNRSTHYKQVVFGPYTKTTSVPIPILIPKLTLTHKFKPDNFRARTRKRIQLWALHKNQVNFNSRTIT